MGYWDTHPLIENQPTIVAFHPDFRVAFIYHFDNAGQLVTYPLNSDYFATLPTAQWIANKFGDSKVYELPFEGGGGPFSASANIYCTKLSNGKLVNCGILAAYYVRNPEDKFPGLAEKLIRLQEGI